jgi:2,4-dienoyl-CoA reductase-like NADH-dependent reductase (Old Yellow Enzyme family)
MHLFRPLMLGRFQIPNRIAMTALTSGYASADGFVSAAFSSYYEERARGGAGLVVIEAACALAPAAGEPHVGLYADAYVPDLRQCVRASERHGAAVLVTIDQLLPTADASEADLIAIADAWFAAAWRAHAAGASGIMLSCADSGPFEQLLSPLTNKRTDAYGGSPNNRMRLLLEVVERVAHRMGERMVIGVRLNVGEYTPTGLTLQDARVIAKRLAGAGVGLLEIASEVRGDSQVARFPGWRVPLAQSIKAVVDVPVMVGGLLADAELADSVIRDGSVDLVALGESLRASPLWPQYARLALSERYRNGIDH